MILTYPLRKIGTFFFLQKDVTACDQKFYLNQFQIKTP